MVYKGLLLKNKIRTISILILCVFERISYVEDRTILSDGLATMENNFLKQKVIGKQFPIYKRKIKPGQRS